MSASELQQKLPGFDVEGALARLGNMEELYVEVLGSFCDEQANTMASMRSGIDGGDYDAARREAHTLKGLAGTIGATTLEAAALDLEQGIDGKLPAGELAPRLDACAQALDASFASIRALG